MKNPSEMSEHDKKNEGGRESGHLHDPNQTQQAGKNQGLADNRMGENRQQSQHAPGQQQQGSHQGSSSQQGSHQQSGSQGRPPGNAPSQEHRKENQGGREKKSA